jgi:spore coat protein A, manganese oxidase
MMLNRRQMIHRTALSSAALALPAGALAQLVGKPRDPICGPNAFLNAAQRSKAKSSPLLTPFVDPLRIPPTLVPAVRGKTHFYALTMKAGFAKLHRDLPTTVVWGFNGLYPGPTIRARKGNPVVVRQINYLPDHPAHDGGMAPLPAVHLHGAHVAPLDDGHPREAIPAMGWRDYHYPNHQRGTTLFYHDHSHGMTGHHVYHGLAGTYVIDDPAELALNLPRGEYDVQLLIQDRLFNPDGSLHYELTPEVQEMGLLGDTLLVNGIVQPFFKVAARKYRFRIVNGSNGRIYELQLSSGQPLIQIGTDGGLLPRPALKSVIQLAPSERADVVMDFGAFSVGTQVILKNCQSCTGTTAALMRFDVDRTAADDSDVPDCLSSWEDLPIDAQTTARQFTLDRQLGPGGTSTWVINGQSFGMNNPPLAQVPHGAVERWRFVNPTNHPHPIHIHLIQFQVLEINGQAQDPSAHGWKDTLVAPPNGQIAVAARFSGYTGRYLFHCHNLEHEDLGMMADYEIVSS